jgi:hypothetical protein
LVISPGIFSQESRQMLRSRSPRETERVHIKTVKILLLLASSSQLQDAYSHDKLLTGNDGPILANGRPFKSFPLRQDIHQHVYTLETRHSYWVSNLVLQGSSNVVAPSNKACLSCHGLVQWILERGECRTEF